MNFMNPLENCEKDPVSELSVHGQARKQEMLATLEAVLVKRRRRRVMIKGMSIVLIISVALGVRLWISPSTDSLFEDRIPDNQSMVRDKEIQIEEALIERLEVAGNLATEQYFQFIQFECIRNNKSVLEKYVVHNDPIRPEVLLDDDALQDILIAANRPAGLIRVQGRAYMVADFATSFLNGLEKR